MLQHRYMHADACRTQVDVVSDDSSCAAPMVVGSDAAHTPSRLSVRSSMPDATTSGGTHAKHAVSPGMTT